MIGAALFIGFIAGLAFAVTLFLLLPRLPRIESRTVDPEIRADSKELKKLQKQLDEINTYKG